MNDELWWLYDDERLMMRVMNNCRVKWRSVNDELFD
jgi:hypothetical protein